jgi:hypothetical protein
MVHGHPDWGEGAIVSTIYRVMDLGELAVRLGSIDTFDRRGNVIFLENFEAGYLKWATSINGTGSSVSLVAGIARSGEHSCLLVGGPGVGRFADVTRSVAIPVIGKLGGEISFAIGSDRLL